MNGHGILHREYILVPTKVLLYYARSLAETINLCRTGVLGEFKQKMAVRNQEASLVSRLQNPPAPRSLNSNGPKGKALYACIYRYTCTNIHTYIHA